MCGCLLHVPWSTTQACALTGNRTGHPLVFSLALNLLSHTSQGWCNYFLNKPIKIAPLKINCTFSFRENTLHTLKQRQLSSYIGSVRTLVTELVRGLFEMKVVFKKRKIRTAVFQVAWFFQKASWFCFLKICSYYLTLKLLSCIWIWCNVFEHICDI